MIELEDKIFTVDVNTFNEVALEVFRYQFNHVAVYRAYCEALNRQPDKVFVIEQIPFLPIEFFRTQTIVAEGKQGELVFESSGTTGSVSSKHNVADSKLYEQSFITSFEKFYGAVSDYTFLALLPSYLERGNSSLVYMAEKLVQLSGKTESGFFLDNYSALHETLIQLCAEKHKTILLGVTYALLDFAENCQLHFPELIVMETGGMKGRREELVRAEVHQKLMKAFAVPSIHSEYGMTELLSQAYSKDGGLFATPAWMKVIMRDMYDPLNILSGNKSGLINVIDLANIYSCSFIATSDIGRLNVDGSFEVLGRMDNSELRGCNLMYV